MLYILLIIIAIGVLLISEGGRKLLGILVSLAIIGALLYVGFWIIMVVIGYFQSWNTTNKPASIGNIQSFHQVESSANIQVPADNNDEWQIYSSKNLGISFQYPKGWYVREEKELGFGYRIYISNVPSDNVNKDNMPSDFQQMWLSTWNQETSQSMEIDTKNNKPDCCDIHGEVIASVLKNNNNILIDTYEYNTAGGLALEAYWENNTGLRYFATNSTEVGMPNQQNMVDNLRKILLTINFIN